MARIMRNKNDDLQAMLKELTIGGQSLHDDVSGFDYTRTVGGFIVSHELIGMVFVPYSEVVSKPKTTKDDVVIKTK